MKSWRIRGSFGLTLSPSTDESTGTSRQPRRLCPSAAITSANASSHSLARGIVLGQEHHSDAVAAGRRQLEAERRALLAEQPVGDLDEDAGPVAGERVRPYRTAMGDVAKELHPLAHDVVARPVADVHDEADAARVVLKGGVVESLGSG